MPSSYGRAIAAAAFAFVLTFSPYAHAAEATALSINDPVTDTLQLWSAVFSSINSLANQLAEKLAPHQSASVAGPVKPHGPKNSNASVTAPGADAAAVALAETATTPVRDASSSNIAQQPQSRRPPSALSPTTIDLKAAPMATTTPH